MSYRLFLLVSDAESTLNESTVIIWLTCFRSRIIYSLTFFMHFVDASIAIIPLAQRGTTRFFVFVSGTFLFLRVDASISVAFGSRIHSTNFKIIIITIMWIWNAVLVIDEDTEFSDFWAGANFNILSTKCFNFFQAGITHECWNLASSAHSTRKAIIYLFTISFRWTFSVHKLTLIVSTTFRGVEINTGIFAHNLIVMITRQSAVKGRICRTTFLAMNRKTEILLDTKGWILAARILQWV